MGPLLLASLVELGIISWRDIGGKQPSHTVAGLPLPSDYIALVLVFGTLGLLSGTGPNARKITALVGWGYVVATFMTSGTGPLNSLAASVSRSQTTTPTATVQ